MIDLLGLFVLLPAGVGLVLALGTQRLPPKQRGWVDRACFLGLFLTLILVLFLPHESWMSILWVELYGIGLLVLMVVRLLSSIRRRHDADGSSSRK